MMLNKDLKPRLIKRLCKLNNIEPTDEVMSLMMTFPYRVIVKPLVMIDSQTGKFTYQQLADNYNLSHRQVSYMVSQEIYD